jgi:hypothetical protein
MNSTLEKKAVPPGLTNAGKGRVKGVPNKVTKQLKDMILGALDEAGGQKYLMAQAHDNPSAFLSLIGKVLPAELKAELTGSDGGPITVTWQK